MNTFALIVEDLPIIGITLCQDLFLIIIQITRQQLKKIQYTKKFKDLLAIPHHSDDDINELEGTLKKMMKNSMKQKKIVLDRMEHLDLITLLKPTIKDVQDIIKTNK